MRRLGLAITFTFSLLVMSSSPLVFAQASSSSYQVEEVFFGTGGALDSSSANYKARQSAGGIGSNVSNSTNFRNAGGNASDTTPYLEMVVNTATIDLGLLSTSSTAYGSGTFTVRTYLSSGYSVFTMSPPPTNESGNPLNPITSAAAPATNTEQFGMNLVANTVPASIGADPVNQPDNTFADGQAAPGYNTTNLYQYNQGDLIASSPKTASNQGIGETDYTVSYIANMAPLTKAGLYTMNHDIVVVGTY